MNVSSPASARRLFGKSVTWGTPRRLVWFVMTCLAVIVASGSAQSAALVRKMMNVDGVSIEISYDPDFKAPGQYFFALNNVLHVIQKKPPFSGSLLLSDAEGNVRVVRRMRSDQGVFWSADFRPLPDGTWAYALARTRGALWMNDIRLIDPATQSDLLTPDWYPVVDLALDAHESVVYAGNLRIFLYYRTRKEDGKEYVDMEVSAIDGSDGTKRGFWTSRGKFPATMTGDYLHFNSIHHIADLKVLASARGTNTLYMIDLAKGEITDQIDRQSWKFENDPFGGFERQHFAQFLPNGNLLLYDNGDESSQNRRSRAVEYRVDWANRVLTMHWQALASDTLPFRFGWGSVALLPDQSRLIGWGDYPRNAKACQGVDERVPIFSRYDAQGKLVYELKAACGWATYRVYFEAARKP